MLPDIYRQLTSLKDLRPNVDVNQLFTDLVTYALANSNMSEEAATKSITNLLNEQQIAELQVICGVGEAELEKYWADSLIQNNVRLPDFPYYQNYIDLTNLEMSLLDQLSESWTTLPVLFVGGGALPMTAIMMAKLRRISSVVLDIDPEAVDLANRVISLLGLDNKVKVILGDGTTWQQFPNFHTIYVAALAGVDDKSKEEIFQNISGQIAHEQIVIARSSWGARQLLYRPLPDLTHLGLKRVLQHDPRDGIVNSIVLLKKSIKES